MVCRHRLLASGARQVSVQSVQRHAIWAHVLGTRIQLFEQRLGRTFATLARYLHDGLLRCDWIDGAGLRAHLHIPSLAIDVTRGEKNS